MKIISSLFFSLCIIGSLQADTGVKNKVAKLYVSHFENVLGTSMELKVTAVSQKNASLAEAKALAEIKRISSLLSAYDIRSEFSQWMKTKNAPIAVSPELFELKIQKNIAYADFYLLFFHILRLKETHQLRSN